MPYVLTVIFYEDKAAKDFTMKKIEMGVPVVIAVNPPILNPPVMRKHLNAKVSSVDLTKLVLTLQRAPLLDDNLAVSNVIWISPPLGTMGTVTSNLYMTVDPWY